MNHTAQATTEGNQTIQDVGFSTNKKNAKWSLNSL